MPTAITYYVFFLYLYIFNIYFCIFKSQTKSFITKLVPSLRINSINNFQVTLTSTGQYGTKTIVTLLRSVKHT